MLTLLLALTANAEPCENATTRADLEAELDSAESAFGELKIPDFLESMDRVATSALPCLDAPVDPALAARIHRAIGLRAFGERDVYAVQAFAAARSLDPEYELPESLVAPISPIREDYETMSLSAGRTVTVPEPKRGDLLFDGEPTLERPAAWGSVFQRLDPDGTLQETTYLRPDDPLPAYEARPMTVGPLPEGGRRRVFGDAPPALVAGAAGAAVLGIGLYAAAGTTHGTWADPETAPGKLDGLRTRTNALSIGAGVAGLTAAGLGVGVGLTW